MVVGEYYEVFNRADPGADACVLYAGGERCAPAHAWMGMRSHALLHHVLEGKGRVRLGRDEWEVGAGESFIFYPHESIWYRADSSDPWAYIWLGIGGTKVGLELDSCGLNRHSPAIRGRPGSALRAEIEAIIETLGEGSIAGQRKRLLVQAHLYSLLAALPADSEDGVGSAAARKSTPYVREIMQFMDQSYSRPLDTAAIARFAGLERTYCSWLFSRATGKSLMRYLRELRMEKALGLLRTTDLSVREVAESVGYGDPGAFAKGFKRILGMLPAEARSGSEPRKPGP